MKEEVGEDESQKGAIGMEIRIKGDKVLHLAINRITIADIY